MSEHTSEPWVGYDVATTYREMTIIATVDEERIATLTPGRRARANQRRIVACVNACAGIPIEALEEVGNGAVLEAVRLLHAVVDSYCFESSWAKAGHAGEEPPEHALSKARAFLRRVSEVR